MVSLMSLVLYSWREISHIPIEGGWVGPWASLDIIKNLTPTRKWTASCPAPSLVTVVLYSEQGNNSVLWTSCHHCIIYLVCTMFSTELWDCSDFCFVTILRCSRLEQNLTTLSVLLLIAYSSCSNTKGVCKIGSCGSEWILLLSLFNLPARA